MFDEMRNHKRQLSQEQTELILQNGEYGTMATFGQNGFPYATPLSYVYLDGHIYFHCATEGHKLRNIENEARVCFTVVSNTEVLPEKFTTKYQSAVVFGRAAVVHGEEKGHALLGLVEKYSPGHVDAGKAYIAKDSGKTKIIKITIEHMTGKGNL